MSPSPKLEPIESEILKIFEDCKSRGMSKEEIRDVFAPLGLPKVVNRLSEVGKKGQGHGVAMMTTVLKEKVKGHAWVKSLLIFLTVFAVGGVIAARNGEEMKTLRFHVLAVVRMALIKILPYWNWTDMYYTRCMVRNPFFEAPNLNLDDCNLCESLDEIARMANVSQTLVNEEFIRREKPFIITDGMDDWDIMMTDQFWFDNITEIYLRQANFQVCNVNTNLRISNGDFTRLLKRLYNPRTQGWFIHWENCQKDMAKSVRQYYRRPYFISDSLDFTGSNWVLMSSDFNGRVYKKIEGTDSLMLLHQVRGSNHVRISPREACRGHCPELLGTLNEGEILVVTNLVWILEYIPGEFGDNLALASEVAWPSME
ncbi:hypothetical protein Fcan01_08941 [Folsomia candida]|uniref:Uncharacterized protein n=1 Tax=Folsomia candida TaxID=158441 RepID=A0A226EI12_FOLCA|nr:hypothetical protein Fcan01_08941 [Folsomia candida]